MTTTAQAAAREGGGRPGRPALERFRFDLYVAVELGAEDYDDAEARIDALVDELRPRLERMVRATRRGTPTVVHVTTVPDSVHAV